MKYLNAPLYDDRNEEQASRKKRRIVIFVIGLVLVCRSALFHWQFRESALLGKRVEEVVRDLGSPDFDSINARSWLPDRRMLVYDSEFGWGFNNIEITDGRVTEVHYSTK